jgi:hypothetical protein
MAKKGRPFVHQAEGEKPVTVSLRLPRDVYARVARYVKRHPGMTLTAFLLEGAQLQLDTPADPRDLILSDDNTVIRELEELVEAAVQRALAKERPVLPALDTSTPAPTPGAPAPSTPDISYNGNPVLQEKAPRGSTRPGQNKLTPRQVASLRAKRQRGTPIKALMAEYGLSKATVFRYLH